MSLINIRTIGTIGLMSGIPCLPTPFSLSVFDMINFNNEYLCRDNEQIYILPADQSYHSKARNDLATRMRGEWILMLDTDHSFEPDLLVRLKWLMDKYNVDVISGFYTKKYFPHVPVVYDLIDGYDFQIKEIDFDKQIIQSDGMGAGSLLIKGSVFKRIVYELKELPFMEYPGYSEDLSFFLRLKKLGIKAYGSTDVEAKHLTWRAVGKQDMEVGKWQKRQDIIVV